MNQDRTDYIYNLFYTINPILFLTAFVLFSLYVKEIVIRFRMQEFDLGLSALSSKENVNHSSNILASLKMLKDRRNNPVNQETDLRDEIKYHTIASDEIVSPMNIKFNSADKMVIQMIQGLRTLLGKDVKVFYQSNQGQQKIEEAYFYERARKYNTAIKIYGSLLTQEWSPTIRSTLLLHLSFCQGMTSNYEMAINTLREILENPRLKGSENWKTSWKLSNELKNLQARSSELQLSQLSLLEKGKAMFNLGNYQKAKEYLGQDIEQSQTQAEDSFFEGLYYMGRAHEEKGEYAKAVKLYSKILP